MRAPLATVQAETHDQPKAGVERAIMAIAARQHGAVTRAQLLAAGASPDTIDRRLKAGRLRLIHRGVYLVGPIDGAHAREMAAVLACGTGAVLSHASAAALWGIVPDMPASSEAARATIQAAARTAVRAAPRATIQSNARAAVPSTARTTIQSAAPATTQSAARAAVHADVPAPIRSAARAADVDVSVPGERRVQRPGIRVHYAGELSADEVTAREAIPVTSVARTIIDLAACMTHRALERALAEAFALRLTTQSAVGSLAARHAGRRGARRLQQLLDAGSSAALTRSEAEEQFLALIRKSRLQRPDTNVEVAGYEVDFFWRTERLVAEIDGRAFHSSNDSFENDRLRDATLLAAGVRVMRVTWRQIAQEPEALLVRLTRALSHGHSP